MNVMPTIEGGLRIDAESATDWALLEAITRDARAEGGDLADQLGGLMAEDPHASDWEDFVVPDLRQNFDDQLNHVDIAIQEAREKADENDAGPLWIHREDALRWYGALNQARLAIEERHRFGPRVDIDPKALDMRKRSAFFRSQFYQTIQGLLLEYAMS